MGGGAGEGQVEAGDMRSGEVCILFVLNWEKSQFSRYLYFCCKVISALFHKIFSISKLT